MPTDDGHYHYASEIHEGVTRDEYLALVRELAAARAEIREIRQRVMHEWWCTQCGGTYSGDPQVHADIHRLRTELAAPREHVHAAGSGQICCPVCRLPWALTGHVCQVAELGEVEEVPA